jgi:hypothetical protein
VTLSSGLSVSRYADLPEAGLVDTLPNKAPADFVGYGVQFQERSTGRSGRSDDAGSHLARPAFS